MVPERRILVTGAGGFFGGHLVPRLRREGAQVLATHHHQQGFEGTALDIRDAAQIRRLFQEFRPTHVIHAAAYGVNPANRDPYTALQVNVNGALHLLEAAAAQGVTRFLHIGSCFEYGSIPGKIPENACLDPTTLYGASKAAATQLLGQQAEAFGVDLIIARPFATWGPGEATHRLVPQIINAWRSGQPLDLTPCDQLRDFTYVEDMAEYLTCLLDVDPLPAGRIVNLGSGTPLRLRDFVLELADQLEIRPLMRFGGIPYRDGEMPSLVADVSYMHQLLGPRTAPPPATSLQRMGLHAGGGA